MDELFRSLERRASIPMPGFYVTRMKKDPRTGNYVGVATWVPRDQPLPGNLVLPASPKAIPRKMEELSTETNESVLPEVSDRSAIQAEHESPAEASQPSQKFKVERRPVRNTIFDPYDAYEL